MQTLSRRLFPQIFTRGNALGLLAAIVLTGALLAPAVSAAQESYSQPSKAADKVKSPSGSDHAELERIMADLQDVLSALKQENSLNSEEVDNYRHELALIYRDLDALSKRLDGSGDNHGGYGHDGYGAPSSNDWQPYPYLKREIWPDNARFKSWDDSADIEFEYSDYGEIVLTIDNFSYEAMLTIQDAYRGQANVKVRSSEAGDVTLTVNDDDGQHEFLVQQGGLGSMFVRGREGYSAPPGRATSPAVPPAGQARGLWYDPYRELVGAGQLGDSQEMNWLIGQYNGGEYETSALRTLGEYLAKLSGTPRLDAIGVLSYVSGGRQRKIEIVDPRTSPASFITVISKAYNMTNTGADYRIRMNE